MWRRVLPCSKPIRIIPIVILCVGAAFAFGFAVGDSDYFFKINKSIDIFGRVYKEVTLNYVDEVDPEKFMRSGIDGMLDELDPYTTFIGEKEGDDIELLTTGKYGGIGVTIGLRDGYITVTSLMEGYAAQRQGVLTGDRIIEVEGKSMIGVKPDQVRSLTRGEPGTVVHLKIEREGEPEPLEFILVREEIILKNVSYADFIEEGIAYIKMDRFSRGAGDELRLAIKELKLKGEVKGLVLDLRENPGGLLDAAVEVVDKFVPRGSLVVSTRGRRPESERKYFAQEEPLLSGEPLVVLVNRNSASASEIVAGAIQDLDRGVILGTRTFGKGLVQTVAPLVYNTELKITTAKYYTPSGRCIQEIDYMNRDGNGVFKVTPDSLRREFRTANGRKVFELGGITPDSVLEPPEASTLHQELMRKSMYFKFATNYAAQHRDGGSESRSDAALLAEFKKFLDEKLFTYQEKGEVKLKELREIADKSKYSTAMMTEIERLSQQMKEEKEKSFDRNKAEVLRILKAEIAARYEGEKGRIRALLAEDTQVQAAVGLVGALKSYAKILAGK